MRFEFLKLAFLFLFGTCILLSVSSCKSGNDSTSHLPEKNLLKDYVYQPDSAFKFELRNTIKGEGYTTYVMYLQSQRWLTEKEVKDNLWWHWLTIVVPDEVKSDMGLLIISGGSTKSKMPQKANAYVVEMAMDTKTVTAELHNVPTQPQEFIGDDYGPRDEDEIIAYGWRKFLEGGAKDEDAKWLARLPMTKASVRAMDVIGTFCNTLNKKVERFTVMGASKRGWTTWTTAAVDDRVKAIAPMVIDMLNIVPSFQHHWEAYGFWAPAVGSYTHEGVMDWLNTEEYKKLLAITEPYSFRKILTMPKFIVSASGDEFFLPDSWKFYWDSIPGEKHLRYMANASHSLSETDAIESLKTFYRGVVDGTPRPDFDWKVDDHQQIQLTTKPEFIPDSIWLWTVENEKARDFRVENIGKKWTKKVIPVNPDGHYQLNVSSPKNGWKAFFAELKFKGNGTSPYKFTTGVVVTPDSLAYPPFTSTKHVVAAKK